MKNFKLIADEKCTIWFRDFYIIEAENLEKAKEVLKESIKKNMKEPDYSETLYDTVEAISVEENQGNPTLEVFENDPMQDAIMTNADKDW